MAQQPKEIPSTKGLELTRPRLHALFDRAMENPYFVVSAGAGYGKTRELSAYLTESKRRVVWMAMTELDNLARYFWNTFARAIARQSPEVGKKLSALGFPASLRDYQNFLHLLSQDPYIFDEPVVFAIDNLHLIDAPLVKEFIARFLSARLENVCVILITRQWPTLDCELHDPHDIITAEQLKFTLEESVSLFHINGLYPPQEEIVRVHTYTAGWPIALSMVALALKNRAAPPSANLLKTAKLPLFWLFEQEIFSQYTPDAQVLLILLSVLDSFPRGLVAAITSAKNQSVFQLLGNNPFIRYEIDARCFYFQPLFLEYLRGKLLSLGRDDVDEVYRKAGDWCYGNGHLHNALVYYKHCRCAEQIWKVVSSLDATRYPKREAEMLIDSILWLPEDFRASHPMTSIVLSVLYANNLQFDDALARIDKVIADLRSPKPEGEKRHLLGEAYVAKGLICHLMERDSFTQWFRKAAKLLPEGSRRWNHRMKMVELGPAIRMDSTQPGALERSLHSFVESAPHIARLFHGAGKGLDSLAHCEAYFLTGNIPCAIENAYKAIYEAMPAEQYDIAGNAYFMLLKIYNLRGDYPKIMDILESIAGFEENPQARSSGMGELSRTWFYAQMGEFSRLAGWITSAASDHHAPASIGRELLVRARSLLAKGDHLEALSLLRCHEDFLEKRKSYILLIYVHICMAIAHKNLGDNEQASAALLRAHQGAEGNKIITPFIEFGNYLRPMLGSALDNGDPFLPANWLGQMYRRCNTFAKRHAYIRKRYREETGQNDPRFDLSKRERELLKNLSQGLTRQEISESMGISLNTVKTLLRQTYSKLGAINSADAIRIASTAKVI